MSKYKFNPLGRYLFDFVKKEEDEDSSGGGNSTPKDLDPCTCSDLLEVLKKIQKQVYEILKILNPANDEEYSLFWENLEINYDNPNQPFWENLEINYDNPKQPKWEEN